VWTEVRSEGSGGTSESPGAQEGQTNADDDEEGV